MDTGSRLENASNKRNRACVAIRSERKRLQPCAAIVRAAGAAIEVWGLRRVHSNGHIAELLFTFGLAPAIRQEWPEV